MLDIKVGFVRKRNRIQVDFRLHGWISFLLDSGRPGRLDVRKEDGFIRTVKKNRSFMLASISLFL
jgi:hypothetical protein